MRNRTQYMQINIVLENTGIFVNYSIFFFFLISTGSHYLHQMLITFYFFTLSLVQLGGNVFTDHCNL